MNDNGTIREYDANNNLIHSKDSDGYEYWKEYDANNNMIHYKTSNGSESWREYDANGNMIHYKNSDGVESWYDSDGNEIDNPTKEGYNSTMNNETTHYIIKDSKFKCGYLLIPFAQYGYNFTPSAHEATKFNDLNHAQMHIRAYSEMHSLNEIDFEILEVTVQHTYKQVVTKQMALKCVEILAWGGAYSDQKQIHARTMLNTYIEQRN